MSTSINFYETEQEFVQLKGFDTKVPEGCKVYSIHETTWCHTTNFYEFKQYNFTINTYCTFEPYCEMIFIYNGYYFKPKFIGRRDDFILNLLNRLKKVASNNKKRTDIFVETIKDSFSAEDFELIKDLIGNTYNPNGLTDLFTFIYNVKVEKKLKEFRNENIELCNKLKELKKGSNI